MPLQYVNIDVNININTDTDIDTDTDIKIDIDTDIDIDIDIVIAADLTTERHAPPLPGPASARSLKNAAAHLTFRVLPEKRSMVWPAFAFFLSVTLSLSVRALSLWFHYTAFRSVGRCLGVWMVVGAYELPALKAVIGLDSQLVLKSPLPPLGLGLGRWLGGAVLPNQHTNSSYQR